MVESSSSNKCITLEYELESKAESMAWSHGEGSSSSLPPNDKIQSMTAKIQEGDSFLHKMLGKKQINNVIESSSLNKVIMLKGVMANNRGHEESTNHLKFDSNPEQSKCNNVKAGIQGAEEGYDVIKIVQSNGKHKIKVDMEESD